MKNFIKHIKAFPTLLMLLLFVAGVGNVKAELSYTNTSGWIEYATTVFSKDQLQDLSEGDVLEVKADVFEGKEENFAFPLCVNKYPRVYLANISSSAGSPTSLNESKVLDANDVALMKEYGLVIDNCWNVNVEIRIKSQPRVKISASTLSLMVGERYDDNNYTVLTATPLNITDPSTCVWSYSPASHDCITVAEDGNDLQIIPKKAGTVTVTATYNYGAGESKSASCDITVTEPEFNITAANMVMLQERTASLGYTISPELSTLPRLSVAWSSDNTDVVTFDEATGLVTAVSGGNATVSATLKNDADEVVATKSCAVSVYGIPAVTVAGQTVQRTSTGSLTATITPHPIPGKKVVWSYADEASQEIIKLSADGTFKAIKAGEAHVKATYKYWDEDTDVTEATCTITVTKKPEMALNEKAVTLKKGGSVDLATAYQLTDLEESEITSKSLEIIDGSGIVSVDGCVVSQTGYGTANVRMTLNYDGGSVEDVCTITTVKPTLAFKRNEITLAPSASTTIRPLVDPADQNLSLSWTITGSDKITIDQNGTGTVTTSADALGKEATVTVTYLENSEVIASASINVLCKDVTMFGNNGSSYKISSSKEVVIFNIVEPGDFGALVDIDNNKMFTGWNTSLPSEDVAVFRDSVKIIRFVGYELNEADVQKLVGFVSTDEKPDFKRTFDFTEVKKMNYNLKLPRGEYHAEDNSGQGGYRGNIVLSPSDIYPKTILEKIQDATKDYSLSGLAAVANYYSCSDATPEEHNTFEIYIPNDKKPVTMFEYEGMKYVATDADEIPNLDITSVVIWGEGNTTKDWIESIDKDIVTYGHTDIDFFDVRETIIDGDLTLTNPNIKEVDFTGVTGVGSVCVNKVDLTACTNLEVARFVDAKVKTIDASSLANLQVLNLTGLHTGEVKENNVTTHTFDELSVNVTNSGTATVYAFDNPTVHTGKTRVDGLLASPEFTEYTEADLIPTAKITGDYSAGYCKGRAYVMDENTLDITLRIKAALTWGKYGKLSSLRQFTRSIKKEIAHLYANKAQIGEDADISADHVNLNTVKIIGPLRPRNMAAFNDYSTDLVSTLGNVGKFEQGDIVCKFLDLTEAFPVKNDAPATVVSTDTGEAIEWSKLFSGVDTKYIDFVIMPATTNPDFIKAEGFAKFTALQAAGMMSPILGADEQPTGKYAMTAYVKKPGSLNDLSGYMSYHILGQGAHNFCELPDHSQYYAHYVHNSNVLNVKEVTLRGTINARDLCNGNATLTEDNHFAYNHTVTNDDIKIEEQGTTTVYGALTMANDLRSLDLSDIKIEEDAEGNTYYKDLTLTRTGLPVDKLEILKLPSNEYGTNVTILPPNFINNAQNLTELCIPSNIEVIEDFAFYNCIALKHVYTTLWRGESEATYKAGVSPKADDPKTNVNHELENACVTLSSNLKSIGTGAFTRVQFSDIYVLAEKAPKCAKQAFDGKVTYGNGGFNVTDQTHPVCRKNYQNGSTNLPNGKLPFIAILHYPVTVTLDEEKNYTDVTRDYSLVDETGAVDGYGNFIAWPRHSEFVRSYNQAEAGLTWNAWPTDREYNAMKYSLSYDNPDNSCSFDEDYMGWHEFVLAKNFYPLTQDPNTPARDFSRFKNNDWYSLCVPYNMTRSQLLDYLGARKDATLNGVTLTEDRYPEVRTLVEVRRSLKNNLITFVFSDDLATKKLDEKDYVGADIELYNKDNNTIWYNENNNAYRYVEPQFPTTEGYENDPIIIKGGYPYIVKPYFSDEEKARIHQLGTDYLGIKNIRKVASDNIGENGYTEPEKAGTAYADIPVPFTGHNIWAIDADESGYNATTKEYAKAKVFIDDSDDATPNKYTYDFTGTYRYNKMVVPTNSFFFSDYSGKTYIYRETYDSRAWSRYTGIIGGRSRANINFEPKAEGKDQFMNVALEFCCFDDSFGVGTHIPQDKAAAVPARFSMSFDESLEKENVTVVFEIPGETDGNEQTEGSTIYTVTGTAVGTSTGNLSKGVYIRNGRKFIVK